MKSAILDVVLVCGLILAIYLGYRGGITKKLFNILALLGSIVLAARFIFPIGGFVSGLFGVPENVGHAVGFLLLVATTMGIAIWAYRVLASKRMSKPSSQFSGMLLGGFEGTIIISLLLLGLKQVDIPGRVLRQQSILYTPFANFAPRTFDLLQPYLPGASYFRDHVMKALEENRAETRGKK